MSLKKINFFIFRLALFFMILWPVYIAYKPGPLPALSMDRIMMIFLLLLFFINGKIIYYKEHKKIIMLLMVYFILNLFSAVLSQNVGGSIAKSIFLFLNGPFVFLFVIFFIKDEEQLIKIIKFIVWTMIVVNIFGVIESIKEQLLFKNFLITVNEYTLNALHLKVREGVYRIRSVFTNPLVYCQFLLASIPLILFYIKKTKNIFMRTFLYLNLLVTIYLIYRTGSRAGLALIFLVPIVNYVIKNYKNRLFRKFFWFFVILIVGMLIVAIREFILSNWNKIQNLQYLVIHGMISQEDVSTFARVLQFIYGLSYIKHNFIFGIGPGEELNAVYPLKSIDNYYLTLLLSVGVLGLITFLYIVFISIKVAIENIEKYNDELTLYLLSSVIIILLYYIILSIPKANVLLFLFLALIYLRNSILKHKVKYEKC